MFANAIIKVKRFFFLFRVTATSYINIQNREKFVGITFIKVS